MPKIKNVDCWLYEINYDEFTVDKIIDSQDISKIHVANNIQYHNSLENAERYFNELETKPEILIACHTSNMGGTPERIKDRMQKICNTTVAKKGLKITF
jgi:transposase